MNDAQESDAHGDYRRQAAQHFGRQQPASAPRIFRPGDEPAARIEFPRRPDEPAQPRAASPAVKVQPDIALWALALLCLVAVFLSGPGWLVVVAALAAAGWYCRSKGIGWPPDVEGLLAGRRIAHAAPRVDSIAGSTGEPVIAFIPFRGMTLGEIFGGAAKIMWRNWPVLIGVPVAVIGAAVAVMVIVMFAVMQFAASALSVVDDVGGLFAGMLVTWGVLTLLMYAIAFPADALLIATSVIATDKAVRGQRIGLNDMLAEARPRAFAVCRLTLFIYTFALIVPMLVFFAAAQASSPESLYPVLFVLFAVDFAFGLLISFAPVVLVIEGRGVVDSLRRSMQIARPAWGRLLIIHLLWLMAVVAVFTLLAWLAGALTGLLGTLVFLTIAFGIMIASFRVLQMLIYTDLRIRQENFDRELLEDWTRNSAG